jgi:hypothetical protein
VGGTHHHRSGPARAPTCSLNRNSVSPNHQRSCCNWEGASPELLTYIDQEIAALTPLAGGVQGRSGDILCCGGCAAPWLLSGRSWVCLHRPCCILTLRRLPPSDLAEWERDLLAGRGRCVHRYVA